jgi:hypothetical protein
VTHQSDDDKASARSIDLAVFMAVEVCLNNSQAGPLQLIPLSLLLVSRASSMLSMYQHHLGCPLSFYTGTQICWSWVLQFLLDVSTL